MEKLERLQNTSLQPSNISDSIQKIRQLIKQARNAANKVKLFRRYYTAYFAVTLKEHNINIIKTLLKCYSYIVKGTYIFLWIVNTRFMETRNSDITRIQHGNNVESDIIVLWLSFFSLRLACPCSSMETLEYRWGRPKMWPTWQPIQICRCTWSSPVPHADAAKLNPLNLSLSSISATKTYVNLLKYINK